MNILYTYVLYRSKFLRLNETTYKDRKGQARKWVWAERPNQTSAVVVVGRYRPLITDKEKLVVIKEFRVPLMGYEWGLPAGLIDPKESIDDAARREMKEETGLDVLSFFRPHSPGIYSSAGMTDEKCFMAYADVDGSLLNSRQEDSEEISVHLMDEKQVQALLNSGEKISAKAYFVFSQFCKDGE